MDKLNVIFALEKDKPVLNASKFREAIIKRYKLNVEKCNELYRLIVNYQVKAYGHSLSEKKL